MNRPKLNEFPSTDSRTYELLSKVVYEDYDWKRFAIDEGKYIDQLEQSKESLLGITKPWPLVDVLKKLTEVADILLHKKDYDGHGWEEMEVCFNRGKEIIDSLDYKNK